MHESVCTYACPPPHTHTPLPLADLTLTPVWVQTACVGRGGPVGVLNQQVCVTT